MTGVQTCALPIFGGLEKKNKIISGKEKKVIAHHEAGHATVSWLLEYANPLVKVTIIPRGKSLGAAWYLPEERQITTTAQMFDEMCAALCGRAAEEVVFGEISTGALNDLERVTKQAYAMVAYYGLSKRIGNLSYYDSSGQQEFSFGKPFSEKTNVIIDEEISVLVEKAYTRAKKILTEHREQLVALANRLLEKEVIFSDDLVEIIGKRPWGETLSIRDHLSTGKGRKKQLPASKNGKKQEEKSMAVNKVASQKGKKKSATTKKPEVTEMKEKG